MSIESSAKRMYRSQVVIGFHSGPPTSGSGSLDHQHLASSFGEHRIELVGAKEPIRHHEQGTAVITAKHGGEADAIELDPVEDVAAFGDAHTLVVL